MARNKKAESNTGTIVVIIIAALLLAYVFVPAVTFKVDGFFGKNTVTPIEQLNTDTCPSDGVTSFVIQTPDKLASTATNVNAEVYIFDGDSLVKSGTSASGSVTMDLTCGKVYQGIALNTTASTGAYATKFSLDAKQAKQTVTAQMVQMGGAKILGIENPADPTRIANISIAAGTVKNFDIKFAANVTEKGYNRPIIMCQVNISSIKAVSIGSFSDGSSVVAVSSLPKRVTASAAYQYYAWEYPKMLDPSVGVVTASGSITSQASITPSTTDSMSCKLVDQATWKASNYVSSSLDNGFKTGAENTETLADVGAADSTAVDLNFVNAGGY